MFKFISIFILALSFSQLLAQLNVPVSVNHPKVQDYNVQIRHSFPPHKAGSSTFCSLGALISFKHVLTVASCVANQEVENLVLYVGSTTWDNNKDNSEVHLVEEIFVHSGFKNNEFLVDNIAVLKVKIAKNWLLNFN
jgi:hypothetical protein